MKKLEIVYRYILDEALENKRFSFTQLAIAKKFGFSLSTVNNALKSLAEIGAIEIKRRSFEILDIRKALYYWMTIRKFSRDIIYATRIEAPITDAEKSVPSNVVFTAFTAYRLRFKEAPTDYSEIYFYIPESELKETKNRFPENKGPQNIFVLKADEVMVKEKNNMVSNSQLFVDLWNIKQWYAHDFLKKLEERLFNEL